MTSNNIKLLNHFDLSRVEPKEIMEQHEISYITKITNIITETYILDSKLKNKSLSLDIVSNRLKEYFQLRDWQIKVEICHNKIEVMTLLSSEWQCHNFECVNIFMDKMGYFCSADKVDDFISPDGGQTNWRMSQWEPMIQPDVTDIVRDMPRLYHITPDYNLDNIFKTGLLPTHRNDLLRFPPRIYLFKGDTPQESIKVVGEKLSKCKTTPRKAEDYVLLEIETSKVPLNVKFYLDPLCENGIYTKDSIPADSIVGYKTVRLKS